MVCWSFYSCAALVKCLLIVGGVVTSSWQVLSFFLYFYK